MENKICEECKKEFLPTRRNQKFCSVLCYQLNVSEQIQKLRVIQKAEI